jgi:hypothetical protein
MSVMARVRTVSEGLFGKILAHQQVATRLASEHEACDFERTSYLARWEDSAGRDADRRAKAVERAKVLADRLEKEHAAAWTELTALGLRRADVDVALEIGRAGLGLSWGFADTAAASLFTDGGAAVGDDVGYGPSRIFSPNETAALSHALLDQSITDFASRFERGAAEWRNTAGESPDPTVDPFEAFAAVVAARIELARYLKAARITGRASIVWQD